MESYTMLSRFLKNRREKKNDKTSRGGKKKDKTGGAGKDDKSDTEDKDDFSKSEVPATEIDEEGFTLRPMTTCENDKSSFYSSSDSDEERETKLRVEIKPLRNGTVPLSASVDELRSTVENMTLSPAGTAGRKVFEAENQMKRSQSVSQQIGNSSPSMRYTYSPLSPPIPPPNPRSSPKVPMTNTSRYAELGDIFSEVGEIQPTPFPQVAALQRNTPTPTAGLKAIPRPPLRSRQEAMLSRTSPSMSGESDLKTYGESNLNFRGPSPLTTDNSDGIPLAVAFHEIVHASFKGNDENQCQIKMAGDIMVSFPAGIIQVFATNRPSQLRFKVTSTLELENLIHNEKLLSLKKNGTDLTFDFDMNALNLLLKTYADEKTGSSYFNVNILKYHIVPKQGVSSCPLHLVAFWKYDKLHTDLRIDYKYNSSAMTRIQSDAHIVNSKTSPPLVDVCIAVPVDGGVTTFQSKPTCQWFPNTNRACWKIGNMSSSSSDNSGVGSLRARFEVTNGPTSQSSVGAQFSCENSTLSGSEFKLMCTGYRVSLIKKRFVSGKYTCDGQSNNTQSEVLPDNGPQASHLNSDEPELLLAEQNRIRQLGNVNAAPTTRYVHSPSNPLLPPQNQNPRLSPKLLPSNSSNISRYAELGDIFSEVEIEPTLNPQISSQRNTPTPTSGLKIIPSPSLRTRQENASPALVVGESVGSLDTKGFGDRILNFRGPSPLTTDGNDVIPLAVAFHEIVHACFKGNDENQCQVKMTGDIMVSFPVSIIQMFANNPTPAQLRFQVTSTLELDNLVPNDGLLRVEKDGNDLRFDFDMSALILLLKKCAEDNSGSSYFNVGILKYHIIPKPGVSSCPLHMVAFWKLDQLHTDLRIDYKYNSSAMTTSQGQDEVHNAKSTRELPPLVHVCIAVPVDGGVTTFQSKPTCQWFSNTNRACWKIPHISSSSDNLGVGSLRARFEISNGPSLQSSVAAQFNCENSTLSGSEFKLLSPGYRVSLIKKRFVSGKYACEAQSNTTEKVDLPENGSQDSHMGSDIPHDYFAEQTPSSLTNSSIEVPFIHDQQSKSPSRVDTTD